MNDTAMSAAFRDALAERRRQQEEEGFTAADDDKHPPGVLAGAGLNYAYNAVMRLRHFTGAGVVPPLMPFWRWTRGWWKPTAVRRDLVKAVALLIAEIERLDRADKKENRS